MGETGNKKRRKRVRVNKKRLFTVIVLFLLCVASIVYILGHFGNSGAKKEEKPAEETAAVEENADTPDEDAETPEEKAEAAADEKAVSHVYSHRGSAGDDELSFAAYDRAVEAGSKYIEADVVVSGDGTVYVARDDHALDMTGVDGYFSGMTDGQIDKLKTKSGDSVIKLKDLFDRYGDSVTYIVDVQYTGSRNTDAFTICVRTAGMEDNVIAASSYFDVLRPLDETFPDMIKLYVCADQATFDVALGHEYVDVVSVPKEIMTADNLKAARDHDKKFSAWTLNTEEEIRSAIDLGADSYFTDDSGLAIKLEKKYRHE